MAKSIQVFARVSSEERELIKACGGLQIIVRRFLADNSSQEEKHLTAIKELQARIAEAQAEINRHAEIIEKLRAQGEHNKKPQSPAPERSLTQFRNRRVAAKISTPKEWESKFKIVYFLLFARNGNLSAADEQTIRLAEASARTRLSNKATVEDAERVIRIVTASLNQACIDPSTGELDSDIINVGMGKSQRERIKLIMQAIKTLQGSSGNDVPFDLIVQTLAEEGLKKEFVEDAIKRLKTAGDLIETSSGRYRVVG